MNALRSASQSLLLLAFPALLVSGEAHAQKRGKGEIALRSETADVLGIEVNGRRYRQFNTDLLLTNIPPGRKTVTIYRLKPHQHDGGATAQTLYEGRLLIRPDYRTVLLVNAKSGEVRIRHEDLLTAAPSPENTPATSPATPPPPLAPGGSDWRASIDGKATDTEKLRLLKARVTARALATKDLMEMLAALSFEDSRLELAKAAWPNITDPENRDAVAALFENPETRRAFETLARQGH